VALTPVGLRKDLPMIPKRPRDPNELAKAIIDIATGERPDVAPDDKDPAAVQRGLASIAFTQLAR
jgi:hypothetical protein